MAVMSLTRGAEGKKGGSANKKMKSKKEGKEKAKSEAGVVLKIYVENFMCHRKLSVPLCRRVLVFRRLSLSLFGLEQRIGSNRGVSFRLGATGCCARC